MLFRGKKSAAAEPAGGIELRWLSSVVKGGGGGGRMEEGENHGGVCEMGYRGVGSKGCFGGEEDGGTLRVWEGYAVGFLGWGSGGVESGKEEEPWVMGL